VVEDPPRIDDVEFAEARRVEVEDADLLSLPRNAALMPRKRRLCRGDTVGIDIGGEDTAHAEFRGGQGMQARPAAYVEERGVFEILSGSELEMPFDRFGDGRLVDQRCIGRPVLSEGKVPVDMAEVGVWHCSPAGSHT
jgi:hypothetical protein